MKVTAQRAVQREVTVAVICDGCGKRVNSDSPDGWEHFMSGHDEWGNDSCESVEWHDACSMRCFIKIARGIVGPEPPQSLEVAYLNVTFLKELFLIADAARLEKT